MNNKGFAVSGIIYGLLVLFIIMLIALLAMFNTRKTVLDQLKNKVLNEVGSNTEIKEFECVKGVCEYKILLKGYYNITLRSSNSSTLKSQIYLNAGEKIYLKINENSAEMYGNKELTNLLLKVDNSTYTNVETFNNKYFLNTEYEEKSVNITPKISVKYIETIRKNKTMNQVRFIKDCISGNDIDNTNEWAEIRAIVKGEDVALNKNVKIYDKDNKEIGSNNYIVDGNLNTKSTDGTCVIIDLGRTYNIDYLYSYHSIESTKRYYDYNLSVSTANIEYKPIYNYEDNNVIVSAFEEPRVKLVGNVYVPIKETEKAKWLRLYHYNNRTGTIYWDAKAQVLISGGYDTIHKKSILYYLKDFIVDNKYELLLEYPENYKYNVIRWKQTSNFTSSNSITGFELIKNDFNTTNFNGLQLSGTSNSLITTSDKKHYEIGSLNGTNGIYGYNDTLITKSVDLWIKIGDSDKTTNKKIITADQVLFDPDDKNWNVKTVHDALEYLRKL